MIGCGSQIDWQKVESRNAICFSVSITHRVLDLRLLWRNQNNQVNFARLQSRVLVDELIRVGAGHLALPEPVILVDGRVSDRQTAITVLRLALELVLAAAARDRASVAEPQTLALAVAHQAAEPRLVARLHLGGGLGLRLESLHRLVRLAQRRARHAPEEGGAGEPDSRCSWACVHCSRLLAYLTSGEPAGSSLLCYRLMRWRWWWFGVVACTDWLVGCALPARVLVVGGPAEVLVRLLAVDGLRVKDGVFE